MLAFVSSRESEIRKVTERHLDTVDVPYIANWIYEHPGLDLNLKGISIADPSLSYGVVQQEIPALRFVQASASPILSYGAC